MNVLSIIDELMSTNGISEYTVTQISELQSVVLYAKPYTPIRDKKIDSYYMMSQELYLLNKNLVKQFESKGVSVQEYNEANFKLLALQSGLAYKIGNNQLAYNRHYGSRFGMRALVINELITKHIQNTQTFNCESCGLCERACPNNALHNGIFKRDNCLRDIMADRYVVDANTSCKLGTRIFGCDVCQAVCPQNSHIKEMEINYDAEIKQMLETGDVTFFKSKIGTNYAKKKRFINLAINALGNIGDIKYITIIEKYLNQADFSNNVSIALNKLNAIKEGKNKNE